MSSADCQMCKYALAQGQPSSPHKVDPCLSVPSSPSFHFLHPFSPSCHGQEFASPALHMISSRSLLPLALRAMGSSLPRPGDGHHPCCPGCLHPATRAGHSPRPARPARSTSGAAVSSVQCPVPRFQCPVSRAQCFCSAQCPGSSAQCPVPGVQFCSAQCPVL